MAFVVFMLLSVQCSATVNKNASEETSIEETVEYEQVVITIHTLRAKERITVQIPCEDLNAEQIPSYEQLLSYIPEEQRNEIMQRMESDKQALSSRMQKMPVLNLLKGRLENTASGNIVTDAEYFVNYLCSVKGFGLLLLFPPFLPITPILCAGLLIINTNGTNGEINKAVEQAIMMPFIGFSVWWVQAYVFSGFAGIAIGINNPDEI